MVEETSGVRSARNSRWRKREVMVGIGGDDWGLIDVPHIGSGGRLVFESESK